MIRWILGCSCFAVIVLFIARYYYTYYCDEMSNILNQIIAKKTIVDTTYKCDTRLGKMVFQANKIIDMLEQDRNKSEVEKEEVKRLIADLSHQLKTPLSNVIMYSDLLTTENIKIENKNAFLSCLKEETSKMDWLLKSLFKISSLEIGAIEFVPENCTIKETITQSISAVFGKAYEKQITIEYIDFKNINLLHNRKWTAEAIINILENAIKYSNIGSKITISVEPRELYTAIVIRDQGIGINPSEFNDIFKRFYRSDKVKNLEGAGIGLYLARRIITKEGGNITVQSEPGKGSCFSLFLQNCKN